MEEKGNKYCITTKCMLGGLIRSCVLHNNVLLSEELSRQWWSHKIVMELKLLLLSEIIAVVMSQCITVCL